MKIEISQPNEQPWRLLVSLLEDISKEKRISRAEIARRSGLTESTVKRVFDLTGEPKIGTVLAIAEAVEARITTI